MMAENRSKNMTVPFCGCTSYKQEEPTSKRKEYLVFRASISVHFRVRLNVLVCIIKR